MPRAAGARQATTATRARISALIGAPDARRFEAFIRVRPGSSKDVADQEARWGLVARIGEVQDRRAPVGHLDLLAEAAIALVPRLDGVLAGRYVPQGEGAIALRHVEERVAHHTYVPEHPLV